MKKLFYSLAALAVVASAGSCQQELNPVKNGDTLVSFSVSTNSPATRAVESTIANGTNIDVLYWEIYGTDLESDPDNAVLLGEGVVKDSDGNKEFNVELKLLADQEYNIIFWGQVDGKSHYDVTDLRNVKISSYEDESANDESRAAFFRVYNFKTENGIPIREDIYLFRPFSQINLGSTTYETSLNQVNGGSIKVQSSEMTVTQIAQSFNTVTGKGEGNQAVTFEAMPTPNGDLDATEKMLEVNGDFYYWLGMNYLIVNGDEDLVKVDVVLNTNMGTVKHTVNSVPVKENYRTNLIGNFLTTGATFKVIVDENFFGHYMGPEFVEIPDYDETTKTWTIENSDQLKYVAQQVNSGENNFEGQTVRLTADIDLGGATWTPIGTEENPFRGTLDGSALVKSADDNYTVSNFVVDVKSYAGLVGNAVGNISNVNVMNAVIKSNHYAGAIAGYIYGNIKNCHVIDSDVQCVPYKNKDGKYDDGDKVGGLVGYVGEGNCEITGCSVSNTTVIGYRDLGGLAGCVNSGGIVTGNEVDDITVIVDRNLDADYVKDTDENASALVGANMTGNDDIDSKNTIGNYEVHAATDENDVLEAVKKSGAVVALPAGEYPALTGVADGVTIIGSEGTVFNGTSSISGKNVTVKNVRFYNPKAYNNNLTDCAALTGYLNNVTFENCEFDAAAGARYCYANGDVVFNNCVFGNSTAKRGVHFDSGEHTVTFNECTMYGFNALGAALKKVTFNNCNINFSSEAYNGFNGVNMYSTEYEYNDCSFAPGTHCDCASNDVIASFNRCSYTDGSDIFALVRYDKVAATCTIKFDGVQYEGGYIVLNAENETSISGKSFTNGLKVKGSGTLVLEDVNVETSEGNALTFVNDAVLKVAGEVSLTGAAAGIHAETAITVTGDQLTVVGNAGSGIGVAKITIENLKHLTAKGNGKDAYGIGTADASVLIENSTIDYVCGGFVQPLFENPSDLKYGKKEPEGGPAIGGAEIKIEGSTIVKADGGSKAAAIGARYHQSTSIVILDSYIDEANGGNASAGIGGSRYSGDISETRKQTLNIYIENSVVEATGGQYGAGIGAGYDTHCNANATNATNDIQIVNSVVTAQGGMYAAGIGTGYHSAALTGSIDTKSVINATSGEKFYKDSYTTAQNIGYGVVDPAREYKDAAVTFTVAGNVIEAPAASQPASQE